MGVERGVAEGEVGEGGEFVRKIYFLGQINLVGQ